MGNQVELLLEDRESLNPLCSAFFQVTLSQQGYFWLRSFTSLIMIHKHAKMKKVSDKYLQKYELQSQNVS